MTSVTPLHALNLDISQQQNFVTAYTSLPQKPSTKIRIFNRSEYYTVHGDDAVFAAREVFHSTSVVKLMKTNPELSYLVLSKNNFEKFLRIILLEKLYQVEVLVENGKKNEWKIKYKGSPGNISDFEEILSEGFDTLVNVIMAVKFDKNNKLGLCIINKDERTFSVCELTDNEFLSQLESIIIQMSPRECLVHSNDTEKVARLKTLLERNSILCTPIKSMEFSLDSIARDLNRLLYFEKGQQKCCKSLPEINMKTALTSLHAAIIYLELTNQQDYFEKCKLITLHPKQFIHLDYSAVKALNIFPKQGITSAERKVTSIFGFLDTCRTAHGRRILIQWIKQPLKDINLLTDRLNVVEVFVNNTTLRHLLHNDYLRRIPDLLVLSKKLFKKKVKLQDIYKIYQTMDKLPRMVDALQDANDSTIQALFVDPLRDSLNDMANFQRMIETTIDLDLVDRGEFLIKPSFDQELEETYLKKEKLEETIKEQFAKVAIDLTLERGKNIKLESTDQLGYFFRVTQKEEPVLRKMKQYKIIGTVKGGVRFVTNQLEDLNSDYNDIKEFYENQQKSVVYEIIKISAEYADTISNINYLIAQLDVLVSFANVSCTAPKPFIRPKLLKEGSGYLKLIQVRHPCLEIQDNMSFNPNDIEFKRDEKSFHIITGPNMGGKSTYIRSVGVSVLLALIGCFVPCDEAEICIVDSIFARVGSEDCQEKGLSTFMLEMVETAGIIRAATENSLIIIDELGRGTSTYEGCGIAWALSEYLAKEVKAFSMFATHFHEITKLAEEVKCVVNSYVTALINENTLTLMYQVKPGVCDQSFGIHVAKMAGFSQEFIQHASNIQHNLEDYRNIKVLEQYDNETKIKILKEGDELIKEVVNKCRQLKHKQINDNELEEYVKKLKTEVQSKNNPYVSAFLLE